MPTRSQPAPPPLTETVRAIYRDHKSGVLEVSADGGADPDDPEGGKRRLFFVRGELHLPSVHALAKKLAPHLPLWPDRPSRSGAAGGGASASASVLSGAKGEVKELMGRIARLVGGWDRAAYTFFEGPQTLPPNLVGPLPTVFLLMEWAIAGRSDVELLADLGGPAAQLVSAGGALSPSVAAVLEPQEAVLVARLAEPATVGEVLRQSGGGTALRRICRLRAVGLLRSRSGTVSESRGALVPAEVLRQFSERIEGGLAERPLDLDPETHRGRIADLLIGGGGLTHFELLGLSTEASEEEIYDAYERIARQVHPVHAERLRMAGREAGLWLLFERATDAYLTLANPERRRAYESKVGLGHDPRPSDEARLRESEKLARGLYQRAVDYIDQQEFHFAVELLRQAIQAHPLAEYYLRLGEAQTKNPNWARQAADSYRKAIELGADEPWVRIALGQLCESLEQYREARRHYEVALAKMPGEPEALAGLARISAQATPEPGKRRGWLRFLRRD